jgi:hypothetical protein
MLLSECELCCTVPNWFASHQQIELFAPLSAIPDRASLDFKSDLTWNITTAQLSPLIIPYRSDAHSATLQELIYD